MNIKEEFGFFLSLFFCSKIVKKVVRGTTGLVLFPLVWNFNLVFVCPVFFKPFYLNASLESFFLISVRGFLTAADKKLGNLGIFQN